MSTSLFFYQHSCLLQFITNNADSAAKAAKAAKYVGNVVFVVGGTTIGIFMSVEPQKRSLFDSENSSDSSDSE